MNSSYHPNDPRSEAAWLLGCYQNRYREVGRTDELANQLATDQSDVFSRSNMRGHITTSALVFDKECQSVLLIHHNVYNRWLPPGGHFEHCPSPSGTGTQDLLWASAKREVAEETGVTDIGCYFRDNWGCCLAFDIDSHAISKNLKKQEESHVHHDVLFLAAASSRSPLKPQLSEVSAAKWVPASQLLELDARMHRIYAKLVMHGLVTP